MKDILSGAFTGTPEGHNIQMLYPLSWCISVFYKFNHTLPWYGYFLTGCHFLCFFLIINRLESFFVSNFSKAVVAVMCVWGILALHLSDLVFVQYTITSAIMGATAIFLLFTTDAKLPGRQFISHNIISIVLVIIAFQLRTEMLLLIFPMIGLAGLFKWSLEAKIFDIRNVKKYMLLISVIIIGMVLSEIVNMAAYGDASWKEFYQLFDNRTELYDFQKIPSYEEHQSFYESIGMRQSEQALLENYDYGIDESIDADAMGKVADYAGEISHSDQNIMGKLQESIIKYIRLLLLRDHTDVQWNIVICMEYIAAIILIGMIRKYYEIWKLIVLGLVRSGLWLFIVYRNRIPVRISHSLYLTEMLLLLALILVMWSSNRNSLRADIEKKCSKIIVIAVLTGGLFIFMGNYSRTAYEMMRRENLNTPYWELQNYCSTHKDSFYFLDIYSVSAYSEKMFVNVDNSLRNYDYLGGWACKSPADKEKLEAYGITDIEDAILNNKKVYVVSKVERSMEWIENYFNEKGIEINVMLEDSIEDNGEALFGIYQIRNLDVK
ncbi:MAG: hypothetical protein PHE02_00245 [Lachnospiraceae bacterium]|nr:hypothetical protein [Lachnospiraceae bacterium]